MRYNSYCSLNNWSESRIQIVKVGAVSAGGCAAQIYVILTYQVPVSALRVYPEHIDTAIQAIQKDLQTWSTSDYTILIRHTHEKYQKLTL